MLIGGQGELEVYLLAGAVVHVEGKKVADFTSSSADFTSSGRDIAKDFLAGIDITVDYTDSGGQKCAPVLPPVLGMPTALNTGDHETAADHIDSQYLAGCIFTGDGAAQGEHHRLGAAKCGGCFLVQKLSE